MTENVQWCTNQRHWFTEMWEVGECIFSTQQDNGTFLKAFPTVRRSARSVMLWGKICWHGLGSIVPLKGEVIADQYKVGLSDHLYPVMEHFYHDGSGLFHVDIAPSHGSQPQVKIHGKFWSNMLDIALLHHHQNVL